MKEGLLKVRGVSYFKSWFGFHAKFHLFLITVLLTSFASSSLEAQQLPDLTTIPGAPPKELLEEATQKRSAIFGIITSSPFKGQPSIGFFLGSKGFALCPLPNLCGDEVPSFILPDQSRTRLETPVVVAVFDDIELALVKFGRKPEEAASLSIAKTEPAIGTWVSLVARPWPAKPLLGAVLDHRTTSDDWRMKNPQAPARQFSVTTSRGLQLTLRGAPYLNSRGEVFAVHYESLPLQVQTLRFCSPVTGLVQRIEKARKENKGLKIPLKAKDHGLVFIESSKEFPAIYEALKIGKIEEAKRHQQALMEKIPKSFEARKLNLLIARQGLESGKYSQLEFMEILKRLVPGDEVHFIEKAYYQYQLAEALIVNGQTKEGLKILEKIDKVYPEGMACAAIAQVLDREGDFEKAEPYLRRAINFTPERIAYWRLLETNLFSQGKKEQSREISRSVSILENLVRTR